MPLRRPCCPMAEFVGGEAPAHDCCPDPGCCRDERRGPLPAEAGAKSAFQPNGPSIVSVPISAWAHSALIGVLAPNSAPLANFANEPPGVRRTAASFLEVFRI